MSENEIEKLASLFQKFPGIGPRQAQRFVQFLLRLSPAARRELTDAIQGLGGAVHQCPECMRYHAGSKKVCSICVDTGRDGQVLAVVASDTDLAALEKSGTYRGRYFVLGGTLHLGAEKSNSLRMKQLVQCVNDLRSRYDDFREVILAFPANPEGDATAEHVREAMMEIVSPSLKITALGRGLSTGSELEYADAETIKSAIDSRR